MDKRSLISSNFITILILFLLFILVSPKPVIIEEGEDDEEKNQAYKFSYNDNAENGPKFWPDQCANGPRQSPIVYDQEKFERIEMKPTFVKFGAYDKKPQKVHLLNNGHGVAISFKYEDNSAPKITGGPLGNNTYVFVSFHYHTPCEHKFKFNPTSCALELHFVHYNEKYGSFDNSTEKEDGIAVLGILYLSTYAAGLKTLPFIPLIKNVLKPKAEYNEENPGKVFTYNDIVDETNVSRLVSYKGSLTTPGCAQIVTWIIFARPHLILETDMKQIREVLDANGNKLLKNNRPVQPLNGRKVFMYSAF